MDIALLIYRPMALQGASKDFEFSRATMEARWQAGLTDARTTLLASPWLAPTPKDLGVRVFDVMHDILVRRRPPAPEARVIPLSAARARPAG
jgi:NTE family protein